MNILEFGGQHNIFFYVFASKGLRPLMQIADAAHYEIDYLYQATTNTTLPFTYDKKTKI